jgi:hypothetical protein
MDKTKKTVLNRKKTYMVEGPGCKSKKTGASLAKPLSQAGLTGREQIRSVGSRSNGRDRKRARAATA